MVKPTKNTFYRPHRRVQEHGELINPHTGDVTVPPSMTKQEFVRECDINNIVKQFSQRGVFTHISAKASQGAYMDLPDAFDFQESLHLVEVARTSFMSLPAKVRDRFHNEPVEFLAFMQDPANLEELRDMGLATRPPRPVDNGPPAPATTPTPDPAPTNSPPKA